jgi:hypothetical protein
VDEKQSQIGFELARREEQTVEALLIAGIKI